MLPLSWCLEPVSWHWQCTLRLAGALHCSRQCCPSVTLSPAASLLQVKVDYSFSPPKVTAVSGDGLPVMMPVKDAIRSCQGGAVYLVDLLLLPCPFTDTTFTGGWPPDRGGLLVRQCHSTATKWLPCCRH
jgi:hypothetical protein